MLRLCPRGVAERFLPHGLPDQIAVASAGDLGHGLRIYPPVRADVRHSARKSPCGALFYEWKTLHALRCHWADGCHARRAWRSDPGSAARPASSPPSGTIFRFSRSFSLPRSRRSPKHPQTMVPDRPKRKLPKHPNLWIPPYLRSPCHHQTLQKHSSMNFPQNSAAIPNFIHKIPTRNPPSPQNPHQLTR